MQSGSSNPYSPWSRVSFCWNKQLAIRCGKLDPYTDSDPPMPPTPRGTKEQWIQLYIKEEEEDRKRLNVLREKLNSNLKEDALGNNQSNLLVLLPEYDPNCLTPISPFQKADWDETHPKTKIGIVMKGGRKVEIVFLRDANGRLTLNENGTYDEKCKQRVLPKYETESRFLFGVATVKLPTGEVVGKRLKPFCYTNKKIVSQKDYNKQMSIEILNVKQHGSERGWLNKPRRENNELWEEDTVCKIRGVQK